jgi:hypothetical protein
VPDVEGADRTVAKISYQQIARVFTEVRRRER